MMHLYSGGSAAVLCEKLAEVVSEAPADPLAPEWMAVPSDGMRRWVTLELARHLGASTPGSGDGIAANFVHAYPGTLRNLLLGADRADPDADPWLIDRMVWTVLEVLEERSDDPLLAELASPPSGSSRFARARRVADLFDRYHLHRPDMVRAWAAGRPIDGTGRPIRDHALWQPHLWRMVREVVGEASPPERLPGLVSRLGEGDLVLEVPARLLLFGFTVLPGGEFMDIAHAAAVHHEVHFFVLEPFRPGRNRSSDVPHDPDGQPLLRSWGRLSRETAQLLDEGEAAGLTPIERIESDPATPTPVTVLERLQHDIRTDSVSRPAPIDPADRSIRFHACYGPMRQVQALRDALLHLLDEPGSDLREEDVLVLCPALDRFAPLIEAVFGRRSDPSGDGPSTPRNGSVPGTRAGPPALRFRIADRSIRATNPILGATAALLELVQGRLEAPAVLDFLALPSVRERFRFDDADLATMAEWVAGTEVRWGFDPEQRARFGIPEAITTNTWQAALDRLLLGAAVHDDGRHLAVGGVAPFGVEGGDVEVLGRLAEALRVLAGLSDLTTETRTVAAWVEALRSATEEMFAAPRDAPWQMEGLQRALASVVESATSGGTSSMVPLTYPDVRRLFEGQLEKSVGRPDYFRGGVTFTSMTPLRWVPFRVVCILGMDQTAFGSAAAAVDDLVAAAPRPGDRDPRAEARQALLEAVLACGDHLMVVRDGQDVRTNQEVPRSVVAAELFDAVVALAAPDQRASLADGLEVSHPRHSFDERCFIGGMLGEPGPWGFDPSDLEGARARRRRSTSERPFLSGVLPGRDTGVVDLAGLQSFFANPVSAFVARAIEARLPRQEERQSTRLPVQPDPLETWRIGDRMLRARLDGTDRDGWLRMERAHGTLPPGVLEDQLVDELDDMVAAIIAEADVLRVGHGRAELFEVDVEIGDDMRIVGTVPLRLEAPEPGPARVQYSRVKPAHRLAVWLDLMALAASDPDRAWRAAVIGRSGKAKRPVEVVELRPASTDLVDRVDPHRALQVAVDCYRRGMVEPIPLFPLLSYEQFHGTAKPSHWDSAGWGGDGEDQAVQLVFGRLGFRELMALPARPYDPPGAGDRVARFADYLWGTVGRSATSADDAARTVTAGHRPAPGEAR